MRRYVLLCTLLVTFGVAAQNNLVGRVYYHPNIMADEINKKLSEATKDIGLLRAETIEKAEQKKGRKLTADELSKLDKELDEHLKMAKSMVDGMKMSVTVTFKDDKNVVLKASMKLDDAAMKAAGIPWAKRKMMKVATAIAPSEKGTYVVKDKMVIMNDGKEQDTLRLSNDGKYLYGKLDEKKHFKLTRIQ